MLIWAPYIGHVLFVNIQFLYVTVYVLGVQKYHWNFVLRRWGGPWKGLRSARLAREPRFFIDMIECKQFEGILWRPYIDPGHKMCREVGAYRNDMHGVGAYTSMSIHVF